MSKRIKIGANIPIILLPMCNFEIATNLKKFSIFTVEDFLDISRKIKNLRKKTKIPKSKYKDLLNFIKLIEIDGIDMILAKIFWKANYRTPSDFFR